MTNSPIESFNNVIKKFFTNRFKFNMLPALEKFEEELSSLNHKEYVYYKKESHEFYQEKSYRFV